MARIRIGGLRLVSTPLKDKVKEYEQEEYFCEWCNIIIKKETVFHKRMKMFLCTECFNKADKGEI